MGGWDGLPRVGGPHSGCPLLSGLGADHFDGRGDGWGVGGCDNTDSNAPDFETTLVGKNTRSV